MLQSKQQCFAAMGVVPDNVTVPLAYDGLVDAIAKASEGLPALETVLPVPSIEIDILTGKKGATDGFAFVDFSDPAEVTAATRVAEACRNRYEERLVPDPFEYTSCLDPEDPSLAGDLGCPCADVLDASDIDGGFPDGAGSHLAHGPLGSGQFCDDSEATVDGNTVVCGRADKQGVGYPLCMECGIGTNVGCPCDLDGDCQGLEDGLRCSGSETDGGWPGGGGGGVCLPAPIGENGREALEEMPWFCLDNCQVLGTMQGWVTPVCLYRDGGVDLSHGHCVDLDMDTSYFMPGECEETNLVPGPADECVNECTVHADCPGLGFPATYFCDSGGHCVPPECAGNGVDFSYCMLYR